MKLNKNNKNQISFINLTLVSTILICFAIDKCGAHGLKDKSPHIGKKSTSHHAHPPKDHAHPPKDHHAHSPKANKISSPPSEAPQAQSPSSKDSNRHSSTFSAAFSDILKGKLKDQPKLSKNSALEHICSHTRYPDICLSTIPELLNHKDKIDVVSVLEASIKACSLQVKLTIGKVKKYAAKSPELDNALGDCKEKYHDALKNLRKAQHAIPSRDFGKVTSMLSAAMADVSTCESRFEDLKSSSGKSKTHGLVSIMVNNCLSINSLIHH